MAGIPAQIVSQDLNTGYASAHTQAINRWNSAIQQRDVLLNYNGTFDPKQYMVRTGSLDDLILHLIYSASCISVAEQHPFVLDSRAFEFGHTANSPFGDNVYTIVCLNHSASASCSNCFDDYDPNPAPPASPPAEVQVKGVVHEMGHALHLNHPCGFFPATCVPDDEIRKGAMCSCWWFDIHPFEADLVHLAYQSGHPEQKVQHVLDLPSYAAGLHECLIDETAEMAPTITMSVYCYVNVPGIDVNPEGYPGVSGTGEPGGLPAGVFGDVHEVHAVLAGYADPVTNIVHMSGCLEDVDGQAPLGHVYVEWSWGKITGLGSADTWVNQTEANCLNGTPSGTADSTGSLELLDVMSQENPDYDGDGASSEREFGSDILCGLRDPLNPYDYYDVGNAQSTTPDGKIDLPNDILGVINNYTGNAGYDPGDPAISGPGLMIDYDRPAVMIGAPAGYHWVRGAPDGIIDLPNDILGVVSQYTGNASCLD